MNRNSRPVYSTSLGRLCPLCGNPVNACECRSHASAEIPGKLSGQAILIGRESKGRGGKVVSVIRNLPLDPEKLKLLAKELKNQCGTGGTVSNGTIEIQGDKRQHLKNILEGRGYSVKISGG